MKGRAEVRIRTKEKLQRDFLKDLGKKGFGVGVCALIAPLFLYLFLIIRLWGSCVSGQIC